MFMKVFITVVIIIFGLQSWSKADIRDFEIEGISIGDSLLDYFSKSNIDKEIRSEFSTKYKNNRFILLGVGQTKEFSLFKKLKQFDEVEVTINPSDKNYIVQGLSGIMLCHNNIEKCMVTKDDIIDDLDQALNKSSKGALKAVS